MNNYSNLNSESKDKYSLIHTEYSQHYQSWSERLHANDNKILVCHCGFSLELQGKSKKWSRRFAAWIGLLRLINKLPLFLSVIVWIKVTTENLCASLDFKSTCKNVDVFSSCNRTSRFHQLPHTGWCACIGVGRLWWKQVWALFHGCFSYFVNQKGHFVNLSQCYLKVVSGSDFK